MVINVLGLTSQEIGITQLIDDPVKASRGGWVFSSEQRDPLYGCRDLRELYDKLSVTGSYKGRCTAPLLVDKKTKRAVSNESSDIVRMLNAATFQRQEKRKLDLVPANLAAEIETTNEWVYRLLNSKFVTSHFFLKWLFDVLLSFLPFVYALLMVLTRRVLSMRILNHASGLRRSFP